MSPIDLIINYIKSLSNRQKHLLREAPTQDAHTHPPHISSAQIFLAKIVWKVVE